MVLYKYAVSEFVGQEHSQVVRVVIDQLSRPGDQVLCTVPRASEAKIPPKHISAKIANA